LRSNDSLSAVFESTGVLISR